MVSSSSSSVPSPSVIPKSNVSLEAIPANGRRSASIASNVSNSFQQVVIESQSETSNPVPVYYFKPLKKCKAEGPANLKSHNIDNHVPSPAPFQKLEKPFIFLGEECTYRFGNIFGNKKAIIQIEAQFKKIYKVSPEFYDFMMQELQKGNLALIPATRTAELATHLQYRGMWIEDMSVHANNIPALKQYQYGIMIDLNAKRNQGKGLLENLSHEFFHHFTEQFSQKQGGSLGISDPCRTPEQAKSLTDAWLDGRKDYHARLARKENVSSIEKIFNHEGPGEYYEKLGHLDHFIDQERLAGRSVEEYLEHKKKLESVFRSEVAAKCYGVKYGPDAQEAKKLTKPLLDTLDGIYGRKLFNEPSIKAVAQRSARFIVKNACLLVDLFFLGWDVGDAIYHERKKDASGSFIRDGIISGSAHFVSNLILAHLSPEMAMVYNDVEPTKPPYDVKELLAKLCPNLEQIGQDSMNALMERKSKGELREKYQMQKIACAMSQGKALFTNGGKDGVNIDEVLNDYRDPAQKWKDKETEIVEIIKKYFKDSFPKDIKSVSEVVKGLLERASDLFIPPESTEPHELRPFLVDRIRVEPSTSKSQEEKPVDNEAGSTTPNEAQESPISQAPPPQQEEEKIDATVQKTDEMRKVIEQGVLIPTRPSLRSRPNTTIKLGQEDQVVDPFPAPRMIPQNPPQLATPSYLKPKPLLEMGSAEPSKIPSDYLPPIGNVTIKPPGGNISLTGAASTASGMVIACKIEISWGAISKAALLLKAISPVALPIAFALFVGNRFKNFKEQQIASWHAYDNVWNRQRDLNSINDRFTKNWNPLLEKNLSQITVEEDKILRDASIHIEKKLKKIEESATAVTNDVKLDADQKVESLNELARDYIQLAVKKQMIDSRVDLEAYYNKHLPDSAETLLEQMRKNGVGAESVEMSILVSLYLQKTLSVPSASGVLLDSLEALIAVVPKHPQALSAMAEVTAQINAADALAKITIKLNSGDYKGARNALGLYLDHHLGTMPLFHQAKEPVLQPALEMNVIGLDKNTLKDQETINTELRRLTGKPIGSLTQEEVDGFLSHLKQCEKQWTARWKKEDLSFDAETELGIQSRSYGRGLCKSP